MIFWLVVSTRHLKNISQNGNLPQIGVKIKNISNHHLVLEASQTKNHGIIPLDWNWILWWPSVFTLDFITFPL